MKIIKSSDISNYLFCPVSWWIGITKGVKITKAMKKGEKHHTHIAKNQPKAKVLHVCITITTIIFVALLLYGFLG